MATLSKALQESALALLLFNTEPGQKLSLLLEVASFDRVYRDVATRVFEFWQDHGHAPIDNTDDLFGDVLDKGDDQADQLRDFLINLRRINIDPNFVISRVDKLIRVQKLKSVVVEAAEILSRGDVDSVDQVADLMDEAMKLRHTDLSPGITLKDYSIIFEKDNDRPFPLGIGPFDKMGILPGRKEMFLFIAPPKRGKTWFLIHTGKHALIHQQKVLHITLELSEKTIIKRYIKSLFAVANRSSDEVTTLGFETSAAGELSGCSREDYTPEFSLDDEEPLRKHLKEFNERYGGRYSNLRIKEFPTRGLSVSGLRRYLDILERDGFIPDVLVIDYADLMQISGKEDHRIGIGNLYKDLRGLAVERNLILVTASQTNREGADSTYINSSHVAEDFSKIATADTVITMSCSDAEFKLGLARLLVANNRVDIDRISVVIAQNYAIGQFCTDSALMPEYSTYKDDILSGE